MNARRRQFTRGGGAGGNDLPPRRSRFRGQYFRRRTSSSGGGGAGYRAGGSFSDDRNDSPPPQTQLNHHQQQPMIQPQRSPPEDQAIASKQDPMPQQQYHPNQRAQHQQRLPKQRYGPRHQERRHQQQPPPNQLPTPPPPLPQDSNIRQVQDIDEIKSLFSKLSTELEQVKTSVKELADSLQQQRQQPTSASVAKPQPSKDTKYEQRRKAKIARQREKRAARLAEKRSLGTSNTTSPQDDVNGGDEIRQKKKPLKAYPELSESELNEAVQALKREFLSVDKSIKSIKDMMNNKGPVVVNEFASSILDHAICDVTSPRKLSEMSSSLYQLLVSEDGLNGVDFQESFFKALSDVSKREDDIAIDAPRYMDTLGQVLAECLVPMVTKKRRIIKKFLVKCLDSYCQRNRAILLASVMRAIASVKDDRFAKNVWDAAEVEWDTYLNEGEDLVAFLESHDVQFTTRSFTPETQKPERSSEELSKFADDLTYLVEKRSPPQALDDMVTDLDLQPGEHVKYFGSLIFAIVRGCVFTDNGDYRLSSESLNKYSSILTRKHEEQDAIALIALVELTKLWHSFNCPQDLLRTIIVALHNQGTASYKALNNWLNAENLNNVPGIGAARLNCKRYIEDLGAAQKP